MTTRHNLPTDGRDLALLATLDDMEELRVRGEGAHRWRVPLAVTAGVGALVLLALPFSRATAPAAPGLFISWGTMALLGDALGVALLVGLYRSGRDLRTLVLGAAFAWSAVLVVALALRDPGLARAEPPWTRAGAELGWLYLSAHVGPPVLVAAALAQWPQRWAAALQSSARKGRTVVWGLFAVLVVGAGSVPAAAALAPDRLPRLVDPGTGHFEPVIYAAILVVNLAAVAVGVAGVLTRRGPSAVQVWTLVAGCAWLGDVAFVGMHGDRYSVAGYGSLLLGLFASLVVPASVLGETWRVQRQLTAGTASLEAQVSQLVEAQRIRDHLSAVVSHDMRTPLAGLQGYLEVLVEDRELDPDLVRRMLERSLMLTRRLSLLSEDLLAATTFEHSDLVITPSDLDVSQQLAECASGFPDLDLRIDCPPGLRVHADPLRLQQILTNLIRNAQRHGAEPVTVDVSGDGENVTVRVADAGEGVPAAFIPRLFERYSQGARATGGAGIGLSVVHDLVQAHGGTIRYDLTQPAFIVTLPVAAPQGPPPAGRVLAAPTYGHATT